MSEIKIDALATTQFEFVGQALRQLSCDRGTPIPDGKGKEVASGYNALWEYVSGGSLPEAEGAQFLGARVIATSVRPVDSGVSFDDTLLATVYAQGGRVREITCLVGREGKGGWAIDPTEDYYEVSEQFVLLPRGANLHLVDAADRIAE